MSEAVQTLNETARSSMNQPMPQESRPAHKDFSWISGEEHSPETDVVTPHDTQGLFFSRVYWKWPSITTRN